MRACWWCSHGTHVQFRVDLDGHAARHAVSDGVRDAVDDVRQVSQVLRREKKERERERERERRRGRNTKAERNGEEAWQK